ncbi:hypothetical protein [uncultured Aquimonas sp.]|jgi:hypothetical protein|uniref:hypothetical protein n=1 Tax=uncultured Aquimonas sp. TaxID=385483 RepID=UPI00263843F7|nr:hypothetical protein [uncultured Aquimonas sp.]
MNPVMLRARMELLRRVLGIRSAETRARMLAEAFEEPGQVAWMERSYLLVAESADEAGMAAASIRQLTEEACFDEAGLAELFLARDHDGLLAFFRL